MYMQHLHELYRPCISITGGLAQLKKSQYVVVLVLNVHVHCSSKWHYLHVHVHVARSIPNIRDQLQPLEYTLRIFIPALTGRGVPENLAGES